MKRSNLVRQAFGSAARALASFALLACAASFASAQGIGSFEKQRGQSMLDQIKEDIKKNYYDPQFHNVDLEATFKAAGEKIKNAVSNEQIMGIIAQAVLSLDDSHTFFIPPQRQVSVDYGFETTMVGDECFVTKVKKDSDAEAKGLKVGDRIETFGQYQPARENFWKLVYLYYALRPQPGVQLSVVSPGAGEARQLDIASKIKPRRRLDLSNYQDYMDTVRQSENEERDRLQGHRFAELEGDALVWKMPAFNLEPEEVDSMMNRAAKFKSLIIDLRGNGGGLELTLLRLLGNIFDQNVTVGATQTRKDSKPLVAKARGGKTFDGKIVVLVDSGSASSSEIFARVLQLEKRATIVGDKTAGAVMRARLLAHRRH